MTAKELFNRVSDIIGMVHDDDSTAYINRVIHDTLVLTCREALSDSQQAFGNLFSQVEYLCRHHRVSTPDLIAIQTMRRHTNHQAPIAHDDLMYDLRALCVFISAVFGTPIPATITGRIPAVNRPFTRRQEAKAPYLRCIITQWNGTDLMVSADRNDDEPIAVDWQPADNEYLRRIFREGMQLNLLDSEVTDNGGTRTYQPRLIVVEPDYLLDISLIAGCYIDCGHHPLLYTLKRMGEKPLSQAILLGNYAGQALDDIIHHNGGGYDYRDSLRQSFQEQALEYCVCPGFNDTQFAKDAWTQAQNIAEAVQVLFMQYDRKKAILEPSFVCERLGVRGRVDLMTTDMRLLVEQKSGKNWWIEKHINSPKGFKQLESHFVQMLLYYGILRYNFDTGRQQTSEYLLYSKFPAQEGLLYLTYTDQLFREIIQYRNQVVATEYHIAQNGFERMLPYMKPETFNVNKSREPFYLKYTYPVHRALTDPLHALTPLEHDYFCRMMTFVFREQMTGKVGNADGRSFNNADLWNMPVEEKRESGNILTGLRISKKERSGHQGIDTITLDIPRYGDDFLPNFRTGDMVYLYGYRPDDIPDVRRSILLTGNITRLRSDSVTVALRYGLHNDQFLDSHTHYAIEHNGGSQDSGINGLYQFACATPARRQLLLGQRAPRHDGTLQLTRSYHPDYDDVLLQAKQARDYYLLVGPPGTGKTSMALRFIVEEELTRPDASILLMSYTNRAVDEICGMLDSAHIDFIRIGKRYSCDQRYQSHLLEEIAAQTPTRMEVRQRLAACRVVVATTSMMSIRQYLFSLKSFTLAVIDEASQILEPNIIGLLSAKHDPRQSFLAGQTADCIRRFILIGDYKQLPAVVQQNERWATVTEPSLHDICLDDCRQSLFERLIRIERRAGRQQFVGILRKQGRMHPDVAAFPNQMFYAQEQLEPVPLPHQTELSLPYQLPSADALDDLLKRHRMVFIPSKPCHDEKLSGKSNSHEAQIVADVLRRIYRFTADQFDAAKTVGVIVPYRNQIAMIRREIEKTGIAPLLDISIDTVERYQGSQRDVIIYSFTVQNIYQLEFLTANSLLEDNTVIDRKLNVALTRARKQMIMTGHIDTLRHDPVIAQLIQFVNQRGGMAAC